MIRKTFLWAAACYFFLTGICHAQPNAPKPYGPVPSENQLRWQEMEYYAFLHFSINTFTDQEWGSGGDDPNIFNPDSLDCRQWARVCKEAGMKGIIITAKHHSGFCLWPSKYTDYSVKNSPWKHGKGDIIRELADACKEYGLKLGVYLSPWDRNYAGYGRPEYITYFRNQLRELLTSYGDIFEIWFDGANGGSGYYGGANETRKIDARTYYDWKNTYKLIRGLQPKIVIWNDGGDRGDLRWVGTEAGNVGETNWSLLDSTGDVPYNMLHYGLESGNTWVPGEVNTSIRPGWFYHQYEDAKVKTLPQLLETYYSSFGRNGTLLLNFPIDRHGLIHANDEKAALQLAQAVKEAFAFNLAAKAKVTATNVRGHAAAFLPARATDGKKDTYWATDDGITSASMTLDFAKPATFNCFMAQEYIRLGQRVKAFTVQAMIDGKWKELTKGTTIGYRRILRFPAVSATQLRFTITDAKACPAISNIGIYNVPPVLTPPAITYTPHIDWKIVGTDDVKAGAIIDGNPNSAWHQGGEKKMPIDVTIDLEKAHSLSGFKYLPDQNRHEGVITNYQFFVSTDGQQWQIADEGEFSNINNNPVWQLKKFTPVQARYIRLRAVRNTRGNDDAGYAEIDVITEPEAGEYQTYPMWNPKLSIEKRVNDVVSRLTLEEKVKQMLNAAPAVPRLGIPAYDWWNETLHGVARTPFNVTSYPQAIAMAASWDTNSLYRMADYSALEGRAIHNKAIELGRTNERYVGLTYWTPNINIFRDPRWGRGQETYGEDPFLTAMLAHAFVHGLQGDDPKYLKAAACAKHFAVHSGPEPSRHVDDFNPSVYDLWDTYLPAFKELVTKADVAGVMCAYNAVNKQPCCANDLLMNDILRKQWKFTGYVTSDCWAIDDFFKYHKTHKEPVTAAVDAVMHGTDIECGTSVYYTLLDAVKSGLIKEEQIDISLRRLFTIRYRLGMFDPVEMVKYAQTPVSALEAPEHQALALKMARQSIVLLKNENSTLPLKKTIKKIAILGPNADNKISVLGNYNGNPSRVVSLLDGIREITGGNAEIIYDPAINFINDTMMVYEDVTDRYSWKGSKGFIAEYFDNRELKGTPAAVRNETGIDHSWQEGQTVVEGIRANNFSARYTSNYTAAKDGFFTFEVEADDGYRLFINDNLVIDAWQRNRWGARTYNLETRKDTVYKLVLEYWQGAGKANVSLRGGNFKATDFSAVADKVKDADVIIFAGGISPQLEGEEMPVNAPGFNGGDRTSVLLPAVQTQLMKTLQSTGKPVVFVMMTGSAIAIPWEDEHIPAIINAWYGGQSAGAAIADVLFGDYDPAGRLPVTFYKNDADLPPFMSYDMTGRTYRYFKGEALYPFGYGLSYSRFAYSGLKAPSTFTKNKSLTVSAMVRNVGAMDGDEVVELYISYPDCKEKAPIRALKGFKRIFLKAGSGQLVTFTLSAEQLSLVDKNTGALYQPDGKMVLSIGGGQPGIKNKTTSNVISKDLRHSQ